MQQALRLCSQERFLVEKQLHILTCEELAAAKERYQHENDYLQQETTQVCSGSALPHRVLLSITTSD